VTPLDLHPDHFQREEIRLLRKDLEDRAAELEERERRLRDLSRRFAARLEDGEGQPGKRVEVSSIAALHRTVVLGDPGSGKSTLLRYLARRVAQNQAVDGTDAPLTGSWAELTPVYVRIGELAKYLEAKPAGTVEEFIPLGLGPCAMRMPGDLLAFELESGRCLFLLDGLDEIVDGRLRV
jgi:predicted NACHT family NTPase